MIPRQAWLAVLAAALGACAHAPREEAAPAGFESRWLPVPSSLDVFDIPKQQVNTFDIGPFLVVETNDVYLPEGRVAYLIDAETVLTADEAKKEYLEKFLQAAYPNATGGPTAFPGSVEVGAPNFETVDAYVSGLREGDERERANWAKERPGEAYPFPETDYDGMRADLLKKLEGRDAVILRYVNARRP